MRIASKTGAAALALACLMVLAVSSFGADERKSNAPGRLGGSSRMAPNFVGIGQWLNSGPLSIADLRGKVVLVDFWTYGCINCVRTLPYVTRLFDAYGDKGLVIVGVHTPEFPFERSTGNVQAAIKRFGIRYPVAQDNNFATWNAYVPINIGPPSSSSIKVEQSFSSMRAKANMTLLIVPFKNSLLQVVERWPRRKEEVIAQAERRREFG